MSGIIPHYHGLIPGAPVPKGRPRFDGRVVYTPRQTVQYSKLVSDYVRLTHKGGVTAAPLSVSLVFLMPRPDNSRLPHPTCRNDLDNLIKSVCDALNGILWVDDGQIINMIASKRWAESEPGVSITVAAVEGAV